MANVFLNDLKLQKVWDAIRKNFYPVPPESGTAQPPTPAMEGDITIAFGRYTSGQYQGYLNSIVSTIGDGKVTTSKLADSAVTKAKLAAGAIDPVVTWGNGTTAGPTITIQAGKDTSVPKAVPAATAEYSGIITTTAQTFSGNKTFKGNILGEQNIEALFGVSAHGHADLSIAAGGGAGTVTCISVNDAVKEPDGTGMITLDDYPTLTVYNTDKTQINSAISQINSKIPIAATASNQLADKDFVNSSINTATATFRGTYTAASDTEAAAQTALAGITTKDLNDYAFVKVENTPQTGIDKYKRYKYNDNNWVYEYTLNNSSFTASQWDAINSTITSAKVAEFNAKYKKPTNGIPATDLDEQTQTLLVLASTALQRVDFFNLGDHDTPVYFDAHGYGQVINALNVPGNIESTAGGVAAHGHADLGISAGGGSGTTTAVRIGNGSPIEAVDGVVTIPTTQISQQPDGTIALGGVAIAVKGLGSYAYRSSINLAEVVGATDVVSSLSNAIGQTHAMAEDNSENIAAHDERILDLESYFDGASAKYALDSDKVDGHHYSELVTAIGISGKTLTWSKGGTAQDALTIPYAKQSTTLETESLEGQEFIFRNSPKTIGADSLKLDRILGRTLVWNQIFPNWRNGDKGISTSASGTLDQQNNYGIIGHKYYVSLEYWGVSFTGSVYMRILQENSNNITFNVQSTRTRYSKVYTCASVNTINVFVTRSAGTFHIDNTWQVDLTLMFGAGYEPTLEEFEALYLPMYHNPNAGELVNNAADGLETVGFNLWDEEWENGYYDINTGGPMANDSGWRNANKIRVFPNTDYYITPIVAIFKYASNGQYLGYMTAVQLAASEGIFHTEANCAYINMFTAETAAYQYNVNLNLSDPAKNGTYEPYKRNVLDLHLEEFKVKDSQGNIITITGGLKQAGSVRDEIVGNKYIRRVGSVDLSTLNFSYLSDSAELRWKAKTAISDCMDFQNSSAVANVVTSNIQVTSIATQNGDTSLVCASMFHTTAYIRNGSSSSSPTGIMNYELATPETYELISPIPTAMPAGTTERRLPEDTSDSVLAPFTCDMTYGTNPGDILASGIAWEKIWGRPTIVHDKSNVSLTTLDRHVIKIGDKELYLIFSVGSDGTSYTLRVATGLNNGVYENEQVFNFATIDDTTINNICHL